MRATDPHFLLFSGTFGPADGAAQWRFVLQPVGSDACLAATEEVADTRPSRLELLAVVRGLEALDQPSRVTLLTGSRYVLQGIRRGLCQWRERRWHWERFGRLVPIRDHDLWQRVDRALEFHQVECSEWRSEEFAGPAWAESDSSSASPRAKMASSMAEDGVPATQQSFAALEADEPALVIVPRAASRRVVQREMTNWRSMGRLERVMQALLTQIGAIWRPAFTRAA
jgi:ribonuclease HI